MPNCLRSSVLSTAVYLCNRNPTTAVQGKTLFEAETFKEGSEEEPVSKDSDTQLECSNEDNNGNSHEEDQQELQQQGSPIVILWHSSKEQRMPDYYGNRVTVADTSGDPKSCKEAITT